MSLAYKPIDKTDIHEEDRNKLENDLIFVGFLVLWNNLKFDSKKYLKSIHNSNRDVIVLTGDHLLTSINTYM